jgi:hypothetical protein
MYRRTFGNGLRRQGRLAHVPKKPGAAQLAAIICAATGWVAQRDHTVATPPHSWSEIRITIRCPVSPRLRLQPPTREVRQRVSSTGRPTRALRVGTPALRCGAAYPRILIDEPVLVSQAFSQLGVQSLCRSASLPRPEDSALPTTLCLRAVS